MFSSGKSAAKREAKKAETAAYMQYLKSVQDTGELKEIESMDVDGVATKPAKYNEAVKAYNTRVQQLGRQMKGESLKDVIQTKQSGIRSSVIQKLQAEDARNTMAFGGQRNSAINNNLGALAQDNSPEARADRILRGMGSNTGSIASMAAYSKETMDYRMVEQNYGQINGSYRQLGATKTAYDEIGNLAKAVNDARKAEKIDKYYGNQGIIGSGDNMQVDPLVKAKKNAGKRGFGTTVIAGAAPSNRRSLLGGV
ncbi:MAG TPA: hypothetical protein VD999_07720 [Vitreimonas sp.]|nr:hypothetical protein [Vitreimonas sp.]